MVIRSSLAVSLGLFIWSAIVQVGTILW
jgi:hypothetical protein